MSAIEKPILAAPVTTAPVPTAQQKQAPVSPTRQKWRKYAAPALVALIAAGLVGT